MQFLLFYFSLTVRLYRQPDGFAFFFGRDNLLFQFVEPFSRLQDLSDYLVTSDEDAPLRVLWLVARMDADALPKAVKTAVTRYQRQLRFIPWAVGHRNPVLSFGNGTRFYCL